jgi:hypothetical protein
MIKIKLRLAMAAIFALCAAPLAHADLVGPQPLSEEFSSVLTFLSPAQRDAIARGRSGDLTPVLQHILATNMRVSFPPGVYPIKAALIMRDGQMVRMSPGAEIRQATIGQSAFAATGKAGVTIELVNVMDRKSGAGRLSRRHLYRVQRVRRARAGAHHQLGQRRNRHRRRQRL